jgi:hypothetical protein
MALGYLTHYAAQIAIGVHQQGMPAAIQNVSFFSVTSSALGGTSSAPEAGAQSGSFHPRADGTNTKTALALMRRTSSPGDKLTGDFGNEPDATSISNHGLFGLLAGNLSPDVFRLLQQSHLQTPAVQCNKASLFAVLRGECSPFLAPSMPCT